MEQSLGYADVKRLEAEGWRFTDHGLRVGNGWLVWAKDPKGLWKIQLLADPDEEPEKFPNLVAAGSSAAPVEPDPSQLALF